MTLMREADGHGQVCAAAGPFRTRCRSAAVAHLVLVLERLRNGRPRRGRGIAISKTMLMSLRTGAASAISVRLSRFDAGLAAVRHQGGVGRFQLGDQRRDVVFTCRSTPC